jgi:hypothetical protein
MYVYFKPKDKEKKRNAHAIGSKKVIKISFVAFFFPYLTEKRYFCM